MDGVVARLDAVRTIVQMAIFGVVLGLAFGYLTVRALRMVYNVMVVEVAIVIGSSYLLFWAAELYFKSSAVLAVVVMGLYLNLNHNCISVEVHHFLHQFYEMIAYLLNTVIFLIAGIRLGVFAFATIGAADDGISAKDDGVRIIAIYVGIIVARSCSMLILYPALKRLGTGMDWRVATIVSGCVARRPRARPHRAPHAVLQLLDQRGHQRPRVRAGVDRQRRRHYDED